MQTAIEGAGGGDGMKPGLRLVRWPLKDPEEINRGLRADYRHHARATLTVEQFAHILGASRNQDL